MTGPAERPALVRVLVGEDQGLLGQALTALLAEVAGDDALSPIEEYAAPSKDEPLLLGPVLDACRTPPFLAPFRVVVARDAESLDAAQVRELAAYLAEPLDTTILVLCFARKSAPAALVKALPAGSRVLDTAPGRGARGLGEWFADHVADGPVRPTREAVALLRDHLGEDLARLEGLLQTLAAAYGPGARIGVGELTPYLGAAGGVAPWDLTDAIDGGDTAGALAALDRMLSGGERHPLQVLATLHRHYQAMLTLDGSGVTDEQGAASRTRLAAFPAGKALRQSSRLGHDRLAQAITLLTRADLELRGQSGLSGGIVLEVLVARLSRISRAAAGPARGRRSR